VPTRSPIGVSVASRFRPLPLRSVIRRAIAAAARAESIPPGLSVSVLVTGAAEIQALNARFAGEDHATDVLAFNLGAGPGEPGEGGVLGEIVLSLDHLESQAAAAGHSVERETAVLTVHGFLHLLGYDHAEPADERRMFTRAAAILGGIKDLAG
jgi:probable rRNA maturation factor